MAQHNLKQFLDQFYPVSDEDFATLLSCTVPRTLKKKEFLIRQGEVEEHVYFLTSGLLHQYFFKGKEMVSTDFFQPSNICGGLVSFLSGKPSYYNIQALENCELLCLSKSELERLYQADRKWQRLGRLLLTSYLISQEKAIMDTIRLTMRERYVQFARNYPDLSQKVPQRRIASFLNIKPETFSRLKPLLING